VSGFWMTWCLTEEVTFFHKLRLTCKALLVSESMSIQGPRLTAARVGKGR
jgi:hypothetical protein